MKRRLYFLFPDLSHATIAFTDLKGIGVDPSLIHAIVRPGSDLTGLPPATERQRDDLLGRLERIFWNGNLALFALAMGGYLLAVALNSTAGMIVAGLVMVASVAGGTWYAITAPHVHIDEFHAALEHGEILLMVDVSRDCVSDVEELMYRRHPEAVVAGSSWTPNIFGV